ncbi:MAG TPA: serine hydrolase, partial [Oscillospiraceae bacterium]|nr:serine hydrolase [Oscillospiraceae bacterium]
MKKLLCAVGSLCFILLSAFPAKAETLSPPSAYSEAYCVMDADTGQMLIGKNPYTEMYPASVTKILTAAMALETLDPAERYTFSKEAAVYDHGSTHLAFSAGETCKIEDLLYGAMVESANDCAQGLADAAAGSIDDFVSRMNEKLAALHCEDSHFVNPTGMPDPNHYTSAYDLCLITKYALTVKGFETYFDAWEWTIGPTNKQAEARVMGTHHAMIVGPENNGVFGYDYATGGKLGWTEEAKHTIVTVAEKDGVRLVCVALKSGDKYDK